MLSGGLQRLRYGSYFQYGECWLIVRTSCIDPPFWGLRAESVRFFSEASWALLLLTGPGQGWALTREQAQGCMEQKAWPLGRDGEFKIKGAPAVGERFAHPDRLRELLQEHRPPRATVRVLRPRNRPLAALSNDVVA